MVCHLNGRMGLDSLESHQLKRLSGLDFSKLRQCHAIFQVKYWNSWLSSLGRGADRLIFLGLWVSPNVPLAKSCSGCGRLGLLIRGLLASPKEIHIPGRLILAHPIRQTGHRQCVTSPGVYHSRSPARWASYQIRNIAGCACAGNAGNVFPRRRFQRKPLVSDPGIHHGTCVTHVPWCMSGSLACSNGENVPGIAGACAPAILRIWQEAHDVEWF